MQLVCIQHPQQEPVSVGEAKQFLRIDHNVEDDLLSHLIQTARSMVESYTQRGLCNQVWRLTTTKRAVIDLPRSPFLRLSAEPQIVGLAAVLDYKLVSYYDRARLLFESGDMFWQKLQVDFVVGYGEERGSVPPALCQAILWLVADLYQNRGVEGKGLGGNKIRGLLQPYLWMSLH